MSKIIRLKQVLQKINVSRSVVYDLIKSGDFPQPIQLSPRTTGYLESEIDSWIEARIENGRKKFGGDK